jgi:methylmalonyl-CoA/ethylmalonyl-CoA epimerase
MFNRISHIGIAVKDIEAAIALHEKIGARLLARRIAKNGTTSLAMLDLGGDLIEPISPLRPDTPLARFIEKHGEGLHHIAYEVSDIGSILKDLKVAGFDLMDEASRPGFGGHGGYQIAFVRPKSCMGTLWELVDGSFSVVD